MATLIEKESFFEQPPLGREHPVHHRLSATGLFSTTTSVGSVRVIGVKEAATPRIPSGLERETVALLAERKRLEAGDVFFSRIEIAEAVQTLVQTYLGRVAELGVIVDVASPVLQQGMVYAEAVGGFTEIGGIFAAQLVVQSPIAITAAVAHAAQVRMTAMQERSQLMAELPYVVTEQGYQAKLRETVSPQAEEYARSLGAYGSLIQSKKLVRETFPTLRRLAIDRENDPDEGGHPVVRFTITTPEPVERVLELDDQLLDAFCREIPPRHQPYLTFTYQFES